MLLPRLSDLHSPAVLMSIRIWLPSQGATALPRVRGEMGHSGQHGYVAVAIEMTAERAAQVLAEVKKQLPERVLDFGHQELKTKSNEPYTQFAFVSTKANQPKIPDVIAGIADNVTAILARDGHEVEMDPTVHAVTRSQPLFRDRPPAARPEPEAPAADSAAQQAPIIDLAERRPPAIGDEGVALEQ